MSTAAVRAWTQEREQAAAPASPGLHAPPPSAPRIWIYTRLLDFSEMPRLRRLLAFVYYRVLRQPPAFRDEDGRLKVYDLRRAAGTRAAARARCTDADDAVIGLLYGMDYPAGVAEEISFCRPEHPRYAQQDLRDRLIYTGDLEDVLLERGRRKLERQARSVIENCRKT